MNDMSVRRRSPAFTLAVIAAVIALPMVIVALKNLVNDSSPEALPESSPRSIADEIRHLQSQPDDTAARLRVGVRLKSDDAVAALGHLQEIPPTAAEYPEALRNIAHILLVSGRDVEAAAALQPLVEQFPDDFGVRLSLAEIWYRQDQPDRALPHAEKALELRPDRAKSYLLVAEILDDLQRTFELVPLLVAAIGRDPSSWDAHLLLAYAAVFSGELDLAEQATDWCLERRPQDVDARRYRSMALRARGRHDAALAEIRQALAVDPDSLECRLIEAEILLYQRQAEIAYGNLQPLYEQNRDRREYLGTLMRAAVMSGRREEARTYQAQLETILHDIEE